MTQEVIIKMPWYKKISVNSIWKKHANGIYLTASVRKFRTDMYYLTRQAHKFGDAKVEVTLRLRAPDRRKYDLDNMTKSIIDALQFCQIFNDDSQVVVLHAEKLPIIQKGELEIRVKRCDNDLSI